MAALADESLKPVITLHRDTLTFRFPDVARQVRLLAEQRIQKVASTLPAPWDREELVAAVESSPLFNRLSLAAQEHARTIIRTWTPAHVEGVLREAVINRGGLNTDAATELTIKFQRTMRLPDDGKAYSLPTGLGQFPLRSVDDFPTTTPAEWMRQGGVVMPLARSEALWIWFSTSYRFAVKIGAGKLDALSGKARTSGLRRTPQNYLVVPGTHDRENDEVLQHYIFPPLNEGACGIELEIVPMSAAAHFREEGEFFIRDDIGEFFRKVIFSRMISQELVSIDRRYEESEFEELGSAAIESPQDTRLRSRIPTDTYEFADWDQQQTKRCIIHSCRVSGWRQITGTYPPNAPLTEKDYEEDGIPWFDDYQDDGEPLAENSAITPKPIVRHDNTRRRGEIREFKSTP